MALQRYHAALEARDLDTVSSMLADDCVYVSAGLDAVSGKAQILASLAQYFEDHPDHQAWDEEVWAVDGWRAASRWGLRAANKRTGTAIHRSGLESITFDEEGMIRRIDVEDRSV